MSSGPMTDPARRAAASGGSIAATPAGFGDVPHIPLNQVVPRGTSDQPALYHLVRPGETLADIASQYRISVGQIVKANGLDSAASVSAGQSIYIPQER